MKILAMYLPQFYRVKENDEWWGEGFTDWVAAKNAKPLYEGHYQPHIPQNDYYYDLLDKSTMQWQAGLMKKYGIDGVCMYHYWFGQGKKILEKPAENLLKWTDIDMQFCFCWDNASWGRSWSSIHTTSVWMNSSEKKPAYDKEHDVLVMQKYGFYDAWKAHFYYLLDFWKDPRYISIDGRPLFLIYYYNDIYCLKEMISCWRHLAQKENIPFPYIVARNNGKKDIDWDYIDFQFFHAPLNYFPKLNQHELDRINYEDVWNKIVEVDDTSEEKGFYGGFVNYDDTPRMGKDGTVIEGGSPESFRKYFIKLLEKSKSLNNPVVFINAWNEWGEGMHLEPDCRDATGYLEAILEARQTVGNWDCAKDSNEDCGRSTNNSINKPPQERAYLGTMEQWMTLRDNKVSLVSYFQDYNLKRVLIYGENSFAKHLRAELKNTDIDVIGIVDRNEKIKIPDYKTYHINDILPDYDCMVVTAWYHLDEILKNFPNERIIGVQSIISELMKVNQI